MTTLAQLTPVDLLTIACAGAVLVRLICLAKCLSYGIWPGQGLRFTMFSLSLSGMGASAFGVAAGLPHSGDALLIAVAGVLLFDRRHIGAPRQRRDP
jgi:hypothetical protein